MNRVILNFTAYFLIPLSTVLFAWDSNWFTTNFSVLSNGMERKNAFAFWGLLVGVYFFCILHQISRKMFPAPRGISLISLSLLLLVCGVVTPYLPENLPFPSFLHVVFSSAFIIPAFPAFPGRIQGLFMDFGGHPFSFGHPFAFGRDCQQCSGNFFHHFCGGVLPKTFRKGFDEKFLVFLKHPAVDFLA